MRIYGLNSYQRRVARGLVLKVFKRMFLISYKLREELCRQYPDILTAAKHDILVYRIDKAIGHPSGIH